jgi:hypothetical protein
MIKNVSNNYRNRRLPQAGLLRGRSLTIVNAVH